MSHRGRSMRSQRGSQQSQVPTTSRRALRESSSSSDEALDVSQETEIDLRRDEKKTYAVAASKYILNMSKNKVPIKCSEVVKHCMRGEIKLYPEIFAKASKQLADVSFGQSVYRFIFFFIEMFLSLSFHTHTVVRFGSARDSRRKTGQNYLMYVECLGCFRARADSTAAHRHAIAVHCVVIHSHEGW